MGHLLAFFCLVRYMIILVNMNHLVECKAPYFSRKQLCFFILSFLCGVDGLAGVASVVSIYVTILLLTTSDAHIMRRLHLSVTELAP